MSWVYFASISDRMSYHFTGTILLNASNDSRVVVIIWKDGNIFVSAIGDEVHAG